MSIDVAVLHERDGLRADAEKAGARVIPVGGRSRPAKLAGLVRLLRATRPDVLHTTLWEADVLGRVVSTVTRTPVVSSLVNINYGPDQLGDATLSREKVRASQFADLVTARQWRRFHANAATSWT